MKSRQTPKIRFAGFTEDWKSSELSDLLSYLKSGLSRMLSNQDIGLPVIRANNINNGILDLDNDIKYWYIDDPQGANTQNYLIHKNDILINFINSEAKMGTAAIVGSEPKRPTIYTTNILNLRTNQDSDPYFIYSITMTEKYKNYIKIITKPAVNQASFTTVDFKEYNFFVPIIKEQTKIGNFFKQLDDMITLLQQELTTLKQTKQGFLQKMFPKEGESVPEVRFPGFTGDWEQHQVIDFSEETFGGGTPKTSIKEYWNGEIPWIQSSDLHEHQVSDVFAKKKITEKGLQNSATKLIPKNSIAIVTRVGVGKIALMQFEYATSQDFLSLGNLKVNEWFGVYSLYNQLQKELNNVQGTSIKGITKNELLDKKINTPTNLEEQTKIGNFFKQLDDTITLHQRELDALKETKKAFLQKMFV